MRLRTASLAPPRPLVLLIALFVGLLCAGCGSQSAGTFHPEGNSVAADSPAPSLPAGPVPFPGKLSFQFDALPPGPQQAAVITADRQFILAYYYAIYTRGTSQGYKAYIGDGNVQGSVAGNVAQQVAEHRGYAGLARYFDTTVQAIASDHGDQQVSYCVDESKLQHTDTSTGRVVPKGYPADQQYYLESDMLAKSKQGAWQVVGTLVTYYPHGQARECKS